MTPNKQGQLDYQIDIFNDLTHSIERIEKSIYQGICPDKSQADQLNRLKKERSKSFSFIKSAVSDSDALSFVKSEAQKRKVNLGI